MKKHLTYTLHSRAFASKYDQMSLKWRLPAVKCHMLRLTKEADRKRHDDPPFPPPLHPHPALISTIIAAPQQYFGQGFSSSYFCSYIFFSSPKLGFHCELFFIVTNPIPWLGVSLGTAPKLIHLRDGLPPSKSDQTSLPGSILLFWPFRKFGPIQASGSVFDFV